MAFLDRATGDQPEGGIRIPVEYLEAALRELESAGITRAEFDAMFALTAGEKTEFTAIWDEVVAARLTVTQIHDALALAEWGRRSALGPYGGTATARKTALETRFGVGA